MNYIKNIASFILVILIAFSIVASVVSLAGCKTQAVKEDKELDPCFQDRYRTREGFPSEVIATECANAFKWERCVKAMKDETLKKEFRDFNDCWSKGK